MRSIRPTALSKRSPRVHRRITSESTTTHISERSTIRISTSTTLHGKRPCRITSSVVAKPSTSASSQQNRLSDSTATRIEQEERRQQSERHRRVDSVLSVSSCSFAISMTYSRSRSCVGNGIPQRSIRPLKVAHSTPFSSAYFRTSAVIFIEQNVGPHIEQKCAVFAPSAGSVSS